MPEAHAHLPADDERGRESAGVIGRDEPIGLADVDRALRESAAALTAGASDAITRWRDELSRSLEALRYARGILSDDITLLRHHEALGGAPATLLDELPAVLAGRPTDRGSERRGSGGDAAPGATSASAEDDEDDEHPQDLEGALAGLELDPGLLTRSELLVAAHEQMADVDLQSPDDVGRVRSVLEGQVAALASRLALVERRLGELRAVAGEKGDDGALPPPAAG